jgi:hypothetical protein
MDISSSQLLKAVLSTGKIKPDKDEATALSLGICTVALPGSSTL